MKQPGQNIKFGHPGVGSFGHLADVLIMQELGVKVTQVPYRGAGPALVDLLAGQVDLSIIGGRRSRPLGQGRRDEGLRDDRREAVRGVPQLTTFGELGYAKLNIDFWHMLLTPARTPRPIVDKLNWALRDAMDDPRCRSPLPTAAWIRIRRTGNARGRKRLAQE